LRLSRSSSRASSDDVARVLASRNRRATARVTVRRTSPVNSRVFNTHSLYTCKHIQFRNGNFSSCCGAYGMLQTTICDVEGSYIGNSYCLYAFCRLTIV